MSQMVVIGGPILVEPNWWNQSGLVQIPHEQILRLTCMHIGHRGTAGKNVGKGKGKQKEQKHRCMIVRGTQTLDTQRGSNAHIAKIGLATFPTSSHLSRFSDHRHSVGKKNIPPPLQMSSPVSLIQQPSPSNGVSFSAVRLRNRYTFVPINRGELGTHIVVQSDENMVEW